MNQRKEFSAQEGSRTGTRRRHPGTSACPDSTGTPTAPFQTEQWPRDNVIPHKITPVSMWPGSADDCPWNKQAALAAGEPGFPMNTQLSPAWLKPPCSTFALHTTPVCSCSIPSTQNCQKNFRGQHEGLMLVLRRQNKFFLIPIQFYAYKKE